MDFKKIAQKLFNYMPQGSYDFFIESKKTSAQFRQVDGSQDVFQEKKKSQEIFSSLVINRENIQSIYNTLINSDIIVREFMLSARNKQYKAFLLFIDGMVDSNLINDFVLKPLMLKNTANSFDGEENRIILEAKTNNVTVRKVKKFDLVEYVLSCLLPQNNISKQTEFDSIVSSVNSGNCALFIDTLNLAFDIEVKGFKQRSIKTENIVLRQPRLVQCQSFAV